LVGFGGWYLVAHTSASPRSVVEHLERLPHIIDVIDRHFGTRLASGWGLEGNGLAADVGRALELSDLLGHGLGGPCASIEGAEEGHWEFLEERASGLTLRRLEDGFNLDGVSLSPPVRSKLEPGDIVNMVLGRRDNTWVPLDAGPAYPARVSSMFHRARAAH
jgi:hypothetical protein